MNEFLIKKRNEIEDIDEELRIGINLSIILNSACYLEGAIEAVLKEFVYFKTKALNKVYIPDVETRKEIFSFYNPLMDDLEVRISRTTGMQNYDQLFELFCGERISKMSNMETLWEGVQILFNFRNVIAHGREASACIINAYYYPEPVEEFSGGYAKLEQYLLKKKIIDKKFTDAEDVTIFFNNEIADHFWSLCNIFLKELSNSLSDDLKEIYNNVIFPNRTKK